MKTLAGTIKTLEKQNGGELKGKLGFFKTKNWKYCNGKYEVSDANKAQNAVMHEYKVCGERSIVWYQQQSDKDGKYLRMKTVDDYRLTEEEKKLYTRAQEIAEQTRCLQG